ncbi:hypothetical protein TNIN_273311 [Trichonephila inaurata madagascariensis]|uniref:Uncharacterized protein n=1 Tax=Trichonephila inaurata madagascariensis TaxID=2747483 RepID=A0A8X6MD11_9ARAC|nr:hypothetical protein TNIN_273311 [Trichonephila inaurata madagascariensis]
MSRFNELSLKEHYTTREINSHVYDVTELGERAALASKKQKQEVPAERKANTSAQCQALRFKRNHILGRNTEQKLPKVSSGGFKRHRFNMNDSLNNPSRAKYSCR